MKKLVIAVQLTLLLQNAWAQASFKLSEDTYDFGKIEEGVQASHTFDITNTGNQPLIVSNVQPSCGCTTPEWTKTPIQPGGKGKIMATYNSQGRPGAFTKIITVTSNATEPTRVLTIKGFVGPKEEKVYSKEELENSPIAVLDRSEYQFGKIESGQSIHQKIKLTNKGKSNLVFKGINEACRCVNYTATKTEVAPGETLEIELVYSPTNQGEQLDIVSLSTNDIKTKGLAVTLKSTVVKSLSNGNLLNQGGTAVPFK